MNTTSPGPESEASYWPTELTLLELTLPSVPDNLALDEALLEVVDASPTGGILRLWESRRPAVVLGRSNQFELEVNEAGCSTARVAVFRRPSGGGSVVIGPGCLMYSLILPIEKAATVGGITGTTQAIMQQMAKVLSLPDRVIEVHGTSDLVWAGRKFSGNSQRWLRRAFIHHGTLLYGADLTLVTTCLKPPPKQPEYRQGRPHDQFVTNLLSTREDLVSQLIQGWNAEADDDFVPPMDRTAELARERFRTEEWIKAR